MHTGKEIVPMKRKHHIGLGLITFLVYVFLIGPLLVIMAASFGEQNALVFPAQGFTLKWYAQVFQINSFTSAALLSVEIAFAATGIALLLGVPAAYAINRYQFPDLFRNFKCDSLNINLLSSRCGNGRRTQCQHRCCSCYPCKHFLHFIILLFCLIYKVFLFLFFTRTVYHMICTNLSQSIFSVVFPSHQKQHDDQNGRKYKSRSHSCTDAVSGSLCNTSDNSRPDAPAQISCHGKQCKHGCTAQRESFR